MSRTSAHRPYRARFHTTDRPVPHHDHRDGPCDLPDVERWRQMMKEHRSPHRIPGGQRCVWELPRDMVGHCPCELCSGRSEKRAAMRSERRRSRLEAAGSVGPVEHDDDPHEDQEQQGGRDG